MSQRIDGKAIAKLVRAEVAAAASSFTQQHGRAPGLEVILVGEDPASVVYTRNKEKAANEVGVRGKLHSLPASTSEAELIAKLQELNADDAVDGILVQLPLPKHIREEVVLETIHPSKDVDGFHPVNVGLLSAGRPGLVPCTPKGTMRLLRETGVSLVGARAVVVGRSNIVGKPMAQLLLAEHATVTIAHSRTKDLAAVCREADVLVAAVGRAEMIGADFVKEGAVVLDVGINRLPDGRLVGDVAFEAVLPKVRAITPVPGGVGPMTIATLLENTVLAAVARKSNVKS